MLPPINGSTSNDAPASATASNGASYANASNGSATIMARALVATAVGAPLELQDIVLDASGLRDDEVVVRFTHSGICHTDVSAIAGVLPVQFPCVLGHEGAGIIERMPPNFQAGDRFKVGDTVLCSYTSCDQCEQCQFAVPSRCEAFFPLNFAGLRSDMTPSLVHLASDGSPVHTGFFGQSSFASHSVVSVRSLVKTETKIPLELVCAFGCGIQTGFGTVINMLVPTLQPRNDYSDLPGIKELGLPTSSARGAAHASKGRPPLGKHSLAIFGAGAVGIAGVIAGALAKDNIDQVIAIDLVDSRLELAKKAGATHVINSSGLTPEQTVEQVQAITKDGQGPRLVMEATGSAVVFGIAAKCIRNHGVVALVGAGPMGKTADIEPAALLVKSGRLQAVLEGAGDPGMLVPYMVGQYERGFKNGTDDASIFAVMRDLVKVYPPEQVKDALADAHSGQVVKPVIQWS